MRSYRSYNDGSYLKKEDVSPPLVLTITDVAERTVTAPGKEPKDKLVLLFKETKKGLVLNMSNGDSLFAITGFEDPSEWIGEQVELYVDDNVAYAGKRVGGVRLRKPNSSAK
jgi:hypothetical protein